MSHIRPIGPHKHEWSVVYSTGHVFMSECTLCGARRCTGATPATSGGMVDAADRTPKLAPWQEAWVAGADLPPGLGQ